MAKKTDKHQTEDVAATETVSAEVEQLRAELEQAHQAEAEAVMQAQRTLADYSNLKKRFEKERDELSKFAGEMTLMRLLPAIDNLERAVMYAAEVDQQTSIYQGVKMTLQQLDEAMSQMGLQRLEVKVGDVFDPHRHEAVESVEGPQGQIMTVLESGYSMHDKVIRPARVKVGGG